MAQQARACCQKKKSTLLKERVLSSNGLRNSTAQKCYGSTHGEDEAACTAAPVGSQQLKQELMSEQHQSFLCQFQTKLSCQFKIFRCQT